MKCRVELFAVVLLVGCSNLSPNKEQIKQSLSNLTCYESFVDQLKTSPGLIPEILQLRDSKKLGIFDPITVDQKYRLIAFEEVAGKVDSSWISRCKAALEKENDFRGFRLIDSHSIIIEIDQFNRRTFTESTSRERTIEFHRLIFSNKRLDRSKFYFGTEYPIHTDTIKENLIYEISHMKTVQ